MSIEIDKIIQSRDFKQVDVDEIEILVDPFTKHGAVIGLKVNGPKGKPFIMPLALEAARDLCTGLMKTIIATTELT